MSAASSSSCSGAITGRRPTNSGIMPYLSRSSGWTSRSRSHTRRSFLDWILAPKPICFWPIRCSMMSSSPTKAPPQMKRMCVVSTCRNSCCGCLRPPLGGTLQTVPSRIFEQRLLDALARDVAGDAGVLPLARDLVDLVDVDDPALRLLDVVVGVLQQVDDDVLDVLADVAGLRQVRGVGDGEGDVEDLGQRLGHQRLAAAGGAEQQDVRLAELDVLGADLGVDPLVVVVDGDGQDLLGPLLPDHVVVEDGLDLGRLGHRRQAEALRLLLDLLGDDVVAEADALVADVDGRSCDELLDLFLALPAEGAREVPVIVALTLGRHLEKCSTSLGRAISRTASDLVVDEAALAACFEDEGHDRLVLRVGLVGVERGARLELGVERQVAWSCRSG